MSEPLYMVFDVESVGLHGEGFAVGWVVVDRVGKCVASAAYSCPPDRAAGSDAGREWVAANVTLPPIGGLAHPAHVRSEFWRAWEYAKSQGATLWADCCWPVEARFLIACVDDAPAEREWGGPYPLHEIATLRLAAGFDPLGTSDRLPDELPAHNPLADARQSARLMLQALAVVAPV